MQALVSQAVGLLQSPRVRESDAGARLLAIIFQKHVVQLGWSIDCATCSQVPVVVPSSAHGDGPAPVMVFIEGLLRSFQVCQVQLAFLVSVLCFTCIICDWLQLPDLAP